MQDYSNKWGSKRTRTVREEIPAQARFAYLEENNYL